MAPPDKGSPSWVTAGGARPGQQPRAGPWGSLPHPAPTGFRLADSPFPERPSPEAGGDRGMPLFGDYFALFHRNWKEGSTWGCGWALEAVQGLSVPELLHGILSARALVTDCLSPSPGKDEGGLCVQMWNERLPPSLYPLLLGRGLPAPP